MLFFLTFYSSKKNVSGSKKILSSTTVSTLIINQHIRMISEGSCDTEDWSNDAENSLLRHRNNITVCFLNTGLMSIRDSIKNIKNLTDPKLLSGSVYVAITYHI